MQADALARQVRGLANGVAVTANWSANALVAQTFLSLARALGPAGVFWLYAAVAAAGAAWVYLALPETAGAPAPAPRSGLRRWRLCRGQAPAATSLPKAIKGPTPVSALTYATAAFTAGVLCACNLVERRSRRHRALPGARRPGPGRGAGAVRRPRRRGGARTPVSR